MIKFVLKGYPLEAKTAPKNRNQSVHTSQARPASLRHPGPISDPLIVSKFHNENEKFDRASMMRKKEQF